MATNKQLKFFKGASAPAAPAPGMIWFCTTDRTIRVYTGSEWEKYSGLVNAEWVAEDKKLNITSANGTVTTLDLSDCASASDITSKLKFDPVVKSDNTNPTDNGWIVWVIVASAVALVVVAGLIFLLVFKKKAA